MRICEIHKSEPENNENIEDSPNILERVNFWQIVTIIATELQ